MKKVFLNEFTALELKEMLKESEKSPRLLPSVPVKATGALLPWSGLFCA